MSGIPFWVPAGQGGDKESCILGCHNSKIILVSCIPLLPEAIEDIQHMETHCGVMQL